MSYRLWRLNINNQPDDYDTSEVQLNEKSARKLQPKIQITVNSPVSIWGNFAVQKKERLNLLITLKNGVTLS